MLRLTWTDTGLDDLEWWAKHDPRKLKRIIEVCLAACRTPTAGIGKGNSRTITYQDYAVVGCITTWYLGRRSSR